MVFWPFDTLIKLADTTVTSYFCALIRIGRLDTFTPCGTPLELGIATGINTLT